MSKVLLVDPEPDSRGAFERALKGAGYEVSVAASGSFALTQLEWDRPHIIVTQARVDDMDGCELFGIVRSDPKTGDIPFLLLAGLERHIAGQAAEAGVDRLCTGHVSVVGTNRFTQMPSSSWKYTLSASLEKFSTPVPWQHQKPALGAPNSSFRMDSMSGAPSGQRPPGRPPPSGLCSHACSQTPARWISSRRGSSA